MFGSQKIAVVIPAYNPEDRLDETLASLPEWLDSVIVVDDGSDPPIRIDRVQCIRHERNLGVGAAILSGYRAAAQVADVAVVMAADGQMDPADLPALLRPIASAEADYVKGDRLSHPDCPLVMPAIRRFGNCCLTFLTRFSARLPGLMDSQCGYTALRLSLLSDLPLDWLYPRYGFPNDMLAAVAGAGGRVAQVRVRPVYRGEGSGIRPWQAAWVYPILLARGPFLRRLSAWRAGRRPEEVPA